MDNGDLAGLGAFYAMMAIMGVAFFFVAVIGYVVGSLFMMKIFEKAGVQGKWRAWVPVYNLMVFFKLGDMSPWLVLYGIGGMIVLSWIPVLGFLGGLLGLALGVFSAMAAWRVGLKLQKEAAWVILYVLLSIVWLGINAFDKSRWNPNVAPAPWATNNFLADRTVWEGVPAQPSAGVAPGYGAAQPYGAPQGYAAPPQGYQPPAPQGYQPPAQPGYAPPAQPGYGAPVPPAPGASAPQAPGAPVPPAATPPAPPTAPPAAPGTPPAPPVDPTQPPA